MPQPQPQPQPHPRTPALRPALLVVSLSLLVATTVALPGCASWEPEVVFPEDFRDKYTKVLPCKKSAHPAANYVETWLSPDGTPAWDAWAAELAAGTTVTAATFPAGSVFVKVQFDDSKCETLSNYTVMKKLAAGTDPKVGDWDWQFVGADGVCNDCNASVSCAACHSPCKTVPWMCSRPAKK